MKMTSTKEAKSKASKAVPRRSAKMQVKKGSPVDKLKQIREELNSFFVNREGVIDGLLVALLAREHLFMEGETGTGKSALANALFSHIEGARIFRIKMDREKGYEDLFGPINVRRLREDGIREYNTKGTLADCDFAFIDEVYDMGGHVSRMFLDALNERVFRNGHQTFSTPLQFAVLASNFYEEDDRFAAFSDRILFRHKVMPVGDAGRIRLLKNPREYEPQTMISRGELEELQDMARDMDVPSVALMDLGVYASKFANTSEKKVSDRRLVWTRNALGAFAVSSGMGEVTVKVLQSAYATFRRIGVSEDEQSHLKVLETHRPFITPYWEAKTGAMETKIGHAVELWEACLDHLERGEQQIQLRGRTHPVSGIVVGTNKQLDEITRECAVPWDQLCQWGVLSQEAADGYLEMRNVMQHLNDHVPNLARASSEKIWAAIQDYRSKS